MQALVQLKDFKLDTTDRLKFILIVGSGVSIGYFTYLSLKVYLNHRKYRHIPGPPNNG